MVAAAAGGTDGTRASAAVRCDAGTSRLPADCGAGAGLAPCVAPAPETLISRGALTSSTPRAASHTERRRIRAGRDIFGGVYYRPRGPLMLRPLLIVALLVVAG